jgi:hypothetical protein
MTALSNLIEIDCSKISLASLDGFMGRVSSHREQLL